MFQCASEPNRASNIETGGIGYSDYWYDLVLCSVEDIPDPTLPVRSRSRSQRRGINEAQVAFPSLTVMNGDARSSNAAFYFYGDETFNNTRLNNNPSDAFSNRHFDGINYAFVDGHVKWYRSRDERYLDQIDNRFAPFTQRPTFRAE